MSYATLRAEARRHRLAAARAVMSPSDYRAFVARERDREASRQQIADRIAWRQNKLADTGRRIALHAQMSAIRAWRRR